MAPVPSATTACPSAKGDVHGTVTCLGVLGEGTGDVPGLDSPTGR